MKVNKKGEAKLEKNEVRTGNFFVKMESGHVKVQDINSAVSFRISRDVATGKWLEILLGKGKEGLASIELYAKTMWMMLTIVPDDKAIEELISLLDDAVNRHPEFYGLKKEDLSDEENERIIEEEKAVAEYMEEMGKLAKDGDSQAR